MKNSLNYQYREIKFSPLNRFNLFVQILAGKLQVAVFTLRAITYYFSFDSLILDLISCETDAMIFH